MSSCIFQDISGSKLGPMEFLATENLLTSLQTLFTCHCDDFGPRGTAGGWLPSLLPYEGAGRAASLLLEPTI